MAIRDVFLIDGTGTGVQNGKTVVVRDGKIDAIVNAKTPTDCGQVVEGKGKYLIPGLWDTGVQGSLYGEECLSQTVRFGITTIVDFGGNLEESTRWRAEVDKEARIGPWILRAGPLFSGDSSEEMIGRHSTAIAVEVPEEAQGAVRMLKQSGVDLIRARHGLDSQVYLAIAQQSRQEGLPVVADFSDGIDPFQAMAAGVNCFADPSWLLNYSDTEKLAREMAKKNIFLVSGLVKRYRTAIKGRSDRETIEKERQILRNLISLQGEMHKSGVRLISGTGFAQKNLGILPGIDLHNELFLLVKAGLTPMEALKTATIHPAQFLKRNDSGTIEAGKRADLTLLAANPLEDIRNTRKVIAVVAFGRIYAGAPAVQGGL